MFDILLKILLYLLIISGLFFLPLQALVWLIRRQPLLKPKQIWTSVINLLIGVLGLWLLKSAILGSEGVLLLIFILMMGGFFALYWKEFFSSFK